MELTETIFFFNHINAKWQIPVPYGSMPRTPPTNYHLPAATQTSPENTC